MDCVRIFTLFLIFIISQSASANLWKERLLPTFQRGIDPTGIGILATGSLGVAVSQPYDEDTREAWKEHQRISESGSNMGDFLGLGIAGGGIALAQVIWDRENGYNHIEALGLSFVTTSLLKYANSRPRPNGLNRYSMPSGHSSTAFATASSLAYSYGWRAAIPGYLIATFVALTRLSDDAHWLSDTIAGATIGVFWGRASATSQNPATGYFEPWLPDGGVGIRWAKHF